MAGQKKRSQRMQLPIILDSSQADSLLEKISGKRGAPLTINASRVEKTSVQCLQILISAAMTWSHDRNDLKISSPSSQFTDDLACLGLTLEHITTGAPAT